MEEFFGSEEALRCFEKSEAIDEKIRQLWTLPNVQVYSFICCAWLKRMRGENILLLFSVTEILFKTLQISFAQELLKATVTEDGGGKSEAESKR